MAALDDCRRALELTPADDEALVGRMLRVAAVIGVQVDGDLRDGHEPPRKFFAKRSAC